MIWYKIDASLAQTLCALSGREECSIGLFLSNIGFRVIWRVKDEVQNDNIPVYNYFTFPSKESRDQRSSLFLLSYCYGDNGVEGRENLLRIMYEIARTCFVLDAKRTPSPERKVRKTIHTDQAEKTSKRQRHDEASSQASDAKKSVTKDHSFGVKTSNGEIVYLNGFEFDTASLEANTTLSE